MQRSTGQENERNINRLKTTLRKDAEPEAPKILAI